MSAVSSNRSRLRTKLKTSGSLQGGRLSCTNITGAVGGRVTTSDRSECLLILLAASETLRGLSNRRFPLCST